MRLAEPYLLVLLVLVAGLLYVSLRRHRPAVIAYSAIQDLTALAPSLMTRLRRALPVLRALALIACVVALARPQWGVEATKIYRQGIAIAMVVDTSSSMAALDLQINDRQTNRLDVVKQTFRAFIEGDEQNLDGREGDLIGMLTFARYADGLSPLTLDHEALLALLEHVKIVPLPEEDGTAIGDAIVLGIERLRQVEGASRVMIVLTDGSNNAGDIDPLQAAQIAKALGIKIYTIGAGSRGAALMPVRARDGGTEFRMTQVFIDEYTLSEVAKLTDGQYFRASDAAALHGIYAEIDRLEKTTNVAEKFQRYAEGFPLAVLIGLGFLALEIVLVNTRLRTVP